MSIRREFRRRPGPSHRDGATAAGPIARFAGGVGRAAFPGGDVPLPTAEVTA